MNQLNYEIFRIYIKKINKQMDIIEYKLLKKMIEDKMIEDKMIEDKIIRKQISEIIYFPVYLLNFILLKPAWRGYNRIVNFFKN